MLKLAVLKTNIVGFRSRGFMSFLCPQMMAVMMSMYLYAAVQVATTGTSPPVSPRTLKYYTYDDMLNMLPDKYHDPPLLTSLKQHFPDYYPRVSIPGRKRPQQGIVSTVMSALSGEGEMGGLMNDLSTAANDFMNDMGKTMEDIGHLNAGNAESGSESGSEESFLQKEKTAYYPDENFRFMKDAETFDSDGNLEGGAEGGMDGLKGRIRPERFKGNIRITGDEFKGFIKPIDEFNGEIWGGEKILSQTAHVLETEPRKMKIHVAGSNSFIEVTEEHIPLSDLSAHQQKAATGGFLSGENSEKVASGSENGGLQRGSAEIAMDERELQELDASNAVGTTTDPNADYDILTGDKLGKEEADKLDEIDMNGAFKRTKTVRQLPSKDKKDGVFDLSNDKESKKNPKGIPHPFEDRDMTLSEEQGLPPLPMPGFPDEFRGLEVDDVLFGDPSTINKKMKQREKERKERQKELKKALNAAEKEEKKQREIEAKEKKKHPHPHPELLNLDQDGKNKLDTLENLERVEKVAEAVKGAVDGDESMLDSILEPVLGDHPTQKIYKMVNEFIPPPVQKQIQEEVAYEGQKEMSELMGMLMQGKPMETVLEKLHTDLKVLAHKELHLLQAHTQFGMEGKIRGKLDALIKAQLGDNPIAMMMIDEGMKRKVARLVSDSLTHPDHLKELVSHPGDIMDKVMGPELPAPEIPEPSWNNWNQWDNSYGDNGQLNAGGDELDKDGKPKTKKDPIDMLMDGF